MDKLELIPLHELLNLTADRVISEKGMESTPGEFFPLYNELGVARNDLTANKSAHRRSILTLTASTVDFIESSDEEDFYQSLLERPNIDDDLKVQVLGEFYRDQGLERQKAAEKISQGLEYKTDTIYEKFSDLGILFDFHGSKTRETAVELLEDYANSDTRREKALEEVGDETGVPRGTLKNWLTEEDLTFTQEVSALIEPESKRELINTADHYFNTSDNVRPMEEALDCKRDTLILYRDDEIEAVPIELLERLDSLFESEPRFEMDNPERYAEETRYGLNVDDDFQEFLFSHLTAEEYTAMTGKSDSTYTRYRNNRTKTVDSESYRKAFQVVSYMYGKHPEPEIQGFVDRNLYGASTDENRAVIDPGDIQTELVENS